MNRFATPLHLMLALLAVTTAVAQARSPKKDKAAALAPATAPTTFAPLPADHELASIWNDPEFTRRLIGGYGFASEVEPRLAPEEQAAYRDKVVPLLREDPARAVPVLERLVKPGASAVFDFTLGNILFQNGDLTNAVKHLEAAAAKFPDYRRAWKSLGFALVRDGRYEQAIPPLTRAVSLGEADGRIFGLLGFAFMNAGRPASAEAAYRQALVFEPENLDFKLGLVKCAVAAANYDYAVALLEELIRQHPGREGLWTLLANVFIQKEQPERAAVTLELLKRLGKATPQNLFLLGDLYLAQDARDLALGAYLAAGETGGPPDLARTLRAAELLASRGAWTETRQLLDRVRSQGGTNLAGDPELKLLRLEARVALSTDAGERAIQVLEQLLLRNPLDGEALIMAGDYYARAGEVERAESRYDAAAKIEGFEARALVKHAQLLVKERKYAPAVELLRKAQKLQPRDHVQRFLDQVEQFAARARG
jgi:Flp pilus assembly protein TadD